MTLKEARARVKKRIDRCTDFIKDSFTEFESQKKFANKIKNFRHAKSYCENALSLARAIEALCSQQRLLEQIYTEDLEGEME